MTTEKPTLRSVLIVDDNEDDRYILRRMLTKAGITPNIFEAHDGQSALEQLAEHEAIGDASDGWPPALIFLDINMPRMDGFEFLEAFKPLRQKKAFESVVLIMFTSSHHDRDLARAKAYEFVRGYILKMPDTIDELQQQIAQSLHPED